MHTLLALALFMSVLGGPSDPGRDEAISRATSSIRAAEEKLHGDATQPEFHFRAPALWMNDPNGPIFYKGWYHLFYQSNPYGEKWGHMHWSHARSKDLVNWEYLPPALWPSSEKGEEHIYSGSCFELPGPLGPKTPIAFYTSIGNRAPEQWAAIPEDDDLIHWHKAPENPVLTSDLYEWRDPFLFALDGSDYMVTGGGKDGRGIVAIYKSKTGGYAGWEDRGIMFQYPDSDVGNVECPNFVKIGDKWVLLVSVKGRVDYLVGTLDQDLRFHSESRGILNEGSYASQLLHDKKGDVVHLAWVPTEDHVGWNGFITLPSILTISPTGTLLRNPLPDLKHLREHEYSVKDLSVDGSVDLSAHVSGELLEVEAEIDSQGATEFGFELRKSGDRSQLAAFKGLSGLKKIHLFLDRGVIDEYLDGGADCRSIRFKTEGLGTGFSVFSRGGPVTIQSLRVYKLKPAKFDSSRLK